MINLHQLFGRFVTPGGSVVGAAEFPIGPRDQNQVFPDVAFDGTNFLATWQQSPGSASDPADTHIMAARVTEAGVVLEPNGFAISTTPTGSYMPRVAFGGGLYLVVWEDGRNSGVWYERDIYTTRVSTAGELLDGPAASGGIRITGGASYQPRYAHIVYSGAEFLVTWAAGSFGSIPGPAGIYGARVSTGGTVTVDDGYGIIVSGRPPTTTTAHYEFPNAVRVGSRLIIAWLDNGENIGQTKGMRAVTVYSLE